MLENLLVLIVAFAFISMVLAIVKKSMFFAVVSVVMWFTAAGGSFHVERVVPLVLDNVVDNAVVGQYVVDHTVAATDHVFGLLCLGIGLLLVAISVIYSSHFLAGRGEA